MSFRSGILPYKVMMQARQVQPYRPALIPRVLRTGVLRLSAPSPPAERYARHPVQRIHFQKLCLLLVHECGNAAGISALAINATHQRGRNVVMTQSDGVPKLMSNDDGRGG